MDKIIGGKLVAEALIERGVDYIFSLSGGHITPIYNFLKIQKLLSLTHAMNRRQSSWPKPGPG